MKCLISTIFLIVAVFNSIGVTAETLKKESSVILINEKIGFNVEGYNYKQSEFPCDIDKKLVEAITHQGKKGGISYRPVNTAAEINNADLPLLAIDIESLYLGKKNHNYGKRDRKSDLPAVEVEVALIKNRDDNDYVLEKHNCAIVTINELTGVTKDDVLDMGTYGVTVCSATHKCLEDLGSDIHRWVASELKN